VGETNDGLELLEFLKQSLQDMVIADISRPRIRGWQAAKKVKEPYPQIKVLILRVHKEKDYLDQAVISGADGCINNRRDAS
jgi:DNA-binding NarL/FixJ family response regulator